jgi:hypothetical protein
MTHKEMIAAIQFIRPNAQFILNGDELEWLDETQTKPTQAEITKGWADYQKSVEAASEANSAAKEALLERLGITAEEAALLLS